MSMQVAELGGMRIANNQTPLLNLTKILGLTLDPYPATEPDNFYYLRGIRTRAKDLVASPEFGYRVRKDLEGKTSNDLFTLLLEQTTGKTQWTREAFAAAKPTMMFEGRILNDLPYDYVISQILGFEAKRFMEDAIGYGRPNVNIVQWLEEGAMDLLVKGYQHVRSGYQSVPLGLAQRAKEAGATINLGHAMVDLQFDGDIAVITLETDGGTKEVRAKQVLLTIPDSAYAQLSPKSPMSQPNPMQTAVKSLFGVPATKVYVNYPTQWWKQLGMTSGRSITDLPMSQVFYLNDPTGRGLTLSPYASGHKAEGFWAPLLPSNQYRLGGDTLAAQAIVEQTKQVHGIDIPSPSELIYKTFDDTNGYGWNMWKPGTKVWELLPKARAPLPGRKVFCCGQAASEVQGWVMESISSVESVLRTHLGVERAAFWPKSYSAT
jgi:monoamine oxidase